MKQMQQLDNVSRSLLKSCSWWTAPLSIHGTEKQSTTVRQVSQLVQSFDGKEPYLCLVISACRAGSLWARLIETSMSQSTTVWTIRMHHRGPGILKAAERVLWRRAGVVGSAIPLIVNISPVVSTLLELFAKVTDCAWRILASKEHEVIVRIEIPSSTEYGGWLRLAAKAPLSLAGVGLANRLQGKWWRRQEALFLSLHLGVTKLKSFLRTGQLPSLVLWSRKKRWIHSLRHQGTNCVLTPQRETSWSYSPGGV